MKPTTGFGETFQYSNLMVATGGYVAAKTATRAKDLRRGYVDAMTTEVLRPLGMTATSLDLDEAQKREHARPHGRTLMFDARPIATETERGVDSVMPAGGAWSNVRDISRWLLLELGNGKLDGKQIVTEATCSNAASPAQRSMRSSRTAWRCSSTSRAASRRSATAAIHSGSPPTRRSIPTTASGSSCSPTRHKPTLTWQPCAAGSSTAVRCERGGGEEPGVRSEATEEAIKKQMEEITLSPDAAFIDP